MSPMSPMRLQRLRRLRATLVAAALAAATSAAFAQSMKPGLWEVRSRMQMGAQLDQQVVQLQQQMAAMPAEQRKMMEDMLARQGVKLGAASAPGTLDLQVCISKEMAERDEIPAAKADCKNSVSPRTGNVLRFSFVCTTPPSSGEGQVVFNGPESYTMKMTVNTLAQGRQEKLSLEGSGRWLASDCGAVKPAAMPR